ncbi:hypothetical protein JMG10_06380 [Nostoc ellipsosporum NOK]|nr:hypothetical protein [Nostoc ellipsosporum NOK]
MRSMLALTVRLLLLSLPVLLLAGCAKDNCQKVRTYTIYTPVFKTKDSVRNNIRSNMARAIQRPGKIYSRGHYIFLNEIDKGIHIIDNTNPAAPVNKAFIDIPGNIDIAVKGNVLYADLYTDMVAIDISNPLNVSVKKIIDNLFPYRLYGNGFAGGNAADQIIVDWQRKDTSVVEDCNQPFFEMGDQVFVSTNGTNGIKSSPFGTGGSMARFAISGDRLYTVSRSDLDVIDISVPDNPVSRSKLAVGWNIETIYPFRDQLFIGSTTGMFIYNITNPDQPQAAGQFSHVQSCDPVIADDNYAYVTLRSGTNCNTTINQLEILRLPNGNNPDPQLIKTYPMANPHGLSKDNDLLFICDGISGMKVYNAADVQHLVLLKTIPVNAYDVIASGNQALLIGQDGLYQYDYTDPNNIRLLSKIEVKAP